MADTLRERHVADQSDPAIGAAAITGADQDVQATCLNSRGVYVATAGNLVCTMADGTSVTFTGLLAGTIYPLKLASITGAGTTITGLLLR